MEEKVFDLRKLLQGVPYASHLASDALMTVSSSTKFEIGNLGMSKIEYEVN